MTSQIVQPGPVYVRVHPAAETVARTIDVTDGVNVDFDASGRVVGVEILEGVVETPAAKPRTEGIARQDVFAQIRALHERIDGGVNDGFCTSCEDAWPCETFRVVGDAAPVDVPAGDTGQSASDADAGPVIRSDVGQYLHDLATHFAMRDWDYTRMHDVKAIRYAGDFAGYHRMDRRIVRTVRRLVTKDSLDRISRDRRLAWPRVRATVVVGLRTDKHLPDGVLDGGGVITHWEETGEYLQMVQPSVGELVANFLIAEPDHPHARMIAAELSRLADRYDERIRAGQVDGREHGSRPLEEGEGA